MEEDPAQWKSKLGFGLCLIGLAVTVLILMSGIKEPGYANENDPGPTGVPKGLAVFLLAAGVIEVVQSIRNRASAFASNTVSESFDWRCYKNAIVFIVAVIAYLFLLPQVGFFIASFLLSAGMLKQLGAKWHWSAIGSSIMLAAVYFIFVFLFKVQLPEGAIISLF